MEKTFVIGDIHGCINSLKCLLYDELKITGLDRLIFLGDYIDRGNNSRAVVNEIIHLRNRGMNVIALRGNHEQMMLGALKFPENYELWKRNGGAKTCKSFMIQDLAAMPTYYLDFFNSLKFYCEIEGYICVHGGLNFDVENPFEDHESMIWMRNTEINLGKTLGRKLIVGHTPMSLDSIRASLSTDIFSLDGGCVYHNVRRNLGYLVALELPEKRLRYVECSDDNF